MITKRDIYFMDLAKRHAASLEKVAGARVGTLVVLKNRVIAFGKNQRKSHPFQAEYGKNDEAIYLHGEVDAIKNALRFINVDELRKATLYVARVKNSSSDPNSPLIYGLAKPCKKGCMRAIANFGLRRVVYSTDEQTFNCLTRNDWHV